MADISDMGAWTGPRLDDWKESVERRLAPVDAMGERLTRVEGKVDGVANDIHEVVVSLKSLTDAFYTDRTSREHERLALSEQRTLERKEEVTQRKADRRFFITTTLTALAGLGGLIVATIALIT